MTDCMTSNELSHAFISANLFVVTTYLPDEMKSKTLNDYHIGDNREQVEQWAQLKNETVQASDRGEYFADLIAKIENAKETLNQLSVECLLKGDAENAKRFAVNGVFYKRLAEELRIGLICRSYLSR